LYQSGVLEIRSNRDWGKNLRIYYT